MNKLVQLLFVECQLINPVAVRKAIEKVLAENPKKTDPATEWVTRWRGVIGASKSITPDDKRVAQILAKHLF